MKLALPALLALAACNAPPTLLPPPFGSPETPEHLFFPSGFAVAGDLTGAGPWRLVVANANASRRYDAGTVLSLDGAWLMAATGDVALQDAATDGRVGHPLVAGRALIGNYSGQVALVGSTFFTASRDTSLLNAVDVAADGSLSCSGTGGQDCRSGVLALAPLKVESPFALAHGRILDANFTDRDALFVGALSPHVEQTLNSVIYGSVTIAAIDPVARTPIATIPAATPLHISANPQGIGALAWDSARRQLLIGGCYQRNLASAAGEPSTSKCFRANQLRIVSPDAGNDAVTTTYDLSAVTGGSDLGDLLLVPGSPRLLYATIRGPDSLVAWELPDDPAAELRVHSQVSTPTNPGGLLRIPRAGAGDLFAVAGQTNNSLLIVDAASQRVIAEVSGLGALPFATALLPSPPAEAIPTAHLAVGLYRDCRIALVDVPLAAPWAATTRARVGGCP